MNTGKRILILLIFASVLYFIARSNVGQSPSGKDLPLPRWVLETPQPVICIGPQQNSCEKLQGVWHIKDSRFMTPSFQDDMPFIVLFRTIYSCKIVQEHQGLFDLRFMELECPRLRVYPAPTLPPMQASSRFFMWEALVLRKDTWEWIPAYPKTWLPMNGTFLPVFEFRRKPIVGTFLRSVDGPYQVGPLVPIPGTLKWVPIDSSGNHFLRFYFFPFFTTARQARPS